MPLIPGEIPVQYFELIRDRLGLIIYQELENQWTQFGDEDLEAPLPNPQISTTPESLKVYIDRIVPIDESECPVVNISYNGATYEKNPLRAEGSNTFFIDVYTKASGDEGSDADTVAAVKLQKILGKIAFILRHSYYKTLGFAPGFIGGLKISSIQIGSAKDLNDLNGCIMGRITFDVIASENVTPVATSDLQGFYTTAKMYLSNRGFVYIDTY